MSFTITIAFMISMYISLSSCYTVPSQTIQLQELESQPHRRLLQLPDTMSHGIRVKKVMTCDGMHACCRIAFVHDIFSVLCVCWYMDAEI